MKKSRIEFIKEAHNEACKDWKERIENEFTEIDFKPKLEVGVWYVKEWSIDKDIDLFLIEGIKGLKIKTTNDNYYRNGDKLQDEIFINDWHEYNDKRFVLTKATDKEIKKALIKEAKKKGFKEGVVILGMESDVKRTLLKGGFELLKTKNSLWFGEGLNGWDIFKDGKWATIIEQPTKLTVEQVEEKLGYKVEIISK